MPPFLLQDTGRRNQIPQPLFLDQSGHGENEGRPFAGSGWPAKIEFRKIEPVIDESQLAVALRAEMSQQILAVVFRASDDRPRLLDLGAEQFRRSLHVKILGVRRKSVG